MKKIAIVMAMAVATRRRFCKNEATTRCGLAGNICGSN